MFFPGIQHMSAKLFPRSLNPDIKMVLRLSDVKGKIKIPAAQNLKLSIMSSIFSFECGLAAGVMQEKSLMAMVEFFFRLLLLKRLRKFFQHLKDPTENERTFADIYLGPDIVKTVSSSAAQENQDQDARDKSDHEHPNERRVRPRKAPKEGKPGSVIRNLTSTSSLFKYGPLSRGKSTSRCSSILT